MAGIYLAPKSVCFGHGSKCSKIIFTQPNYRVKVGNYLDRFKVNKDIKVFKKDFPNAIVTPEKIEIN